MACVVDAATGIETLLTFSEARKQVILADTLIVSKADLVDGKAVEALRNRLTGLNPHATVTLSDHGNVGAAALVEPPATERGGFVAEAEHTDDIRSFVITDDEPLDWPAFTRVMDTLASLRGPDLLRVKGFIAVAGCKGPVLVQYVQHLAHPPVELERWPDENHGTRLVFITRNIAEQQVRGLLAAVTALT
jgi:G3E family GTPase